MRKFVGLLAAAALIAGPALAQIHVDQHDRTTDYTSRGLSGLVDGWAFNRYAIDHQGGGYNHNQGISQWSCVMQDQNCATLENFHFTLHGSDTTKPWGDINGSPDENNVLASTGIFQSPSGQSAGACAWIYTLTLTTPITQHGTGGYDHDIYTGTFLVSNAGWVSDGASSHISIIGQGGSQEIPLMPNGGPPNDPEQTQEYGVTVLGDQNGVFQAGSQSYPGSPRIWINRLRYDHATNGGVENPVYLGTVPAAGPRNFGWAGDYPDLVDITGSTTARFDDLVFQGRHVSMFGATVTGQMVLSVSLIRDVTGMPLNLGPTGTLELNPIGDALFDASLGGAFPSFTQPAAAQDVDYPLTVQGGAIPASILNDLHTFNVNIYCQELRIDLATGMTSLGSLDAMHFRR